jgi:hypothetical protein
MVLPISRRFSKRALPAKPAMVCAMYSADCDVHTATSTMSAMEGSQPAC